MSKVHAVLLRPHEGDPHGLLKEGPFGARPPMVVRVRGRWINPFGALSLSCAIDELKLPTALVLAWDGEPLGVGLDRATAAALFGVGIVWGDHPALGDRRWHTHEIAEWVGPALADLCSCTLVLLYAEDREVSDE